MYYTNPSVEGILLPTYSPLNKLWPVDFYILDPVGIFLLICCEYLQHPHVFL